MINKRWSALLRDDTDSPSGVRFESFSDVLLILIVIFLSFTTINAFSRVSLPLVEEAGEGPSPEERVLKVEVTSAGEIFVDGEQSSVQKMGAYKGRKYLWLIGGDKRAPWGTILKLVLMQQKAGGKVEFLVEEEKTDA